ncbi:sugar transferase [Salinarimonas sp.]|uniref:sugar transferase n=1 Tax=Salinarimonas sp. TaxID=2766526 RepID=UPI0032D90EA0
MQDVHEELGRHASNARTLRRPVGGLAKRALDVAIAAAALLFLLPLFLAVAAIVRGSDGGPALYRHRRIGLDGREFHCLKFRTMVPDAEAALQNHLRRDPLAAAEWRRTRKLKQDPRVTRLGGVMRQTSVDELPQLVNVLRGEMSIVGPRPIVHDEILKYGGAIEHYFRVRPGLTGPWQISGRSDTGYDERVSLDTDYVSNWSVERDIVIIVKTVPAVLSRRGSY